MGWITFAAVVMIMIGFFQIVDGVAAIANFLWLPYYPIWSVIVIALAVTVIWALTAHGRDIAA